MNRIMHFRYALRQFVPSGIVSVLLILAAAFITRFMGQESLIAIVFVGVVSSVVATLILRVTDKYYVSIHMYRTLRSSAREFLMQVDMPTGCDCKQTPIEIICELRQRYFQMCVWAEDILYRQEAKEITKSVYNVVVAIKDGSGV